MAQDRAYASIDGGLTRVGNAWMERRCTVFGGETITLIDKRDGFNWISGPTVEFRAEVEGTACCLGDLGPAEWSEETNPKGAGLMARYTGERIRLDLRMTALHDLPVLVKTISITNMAKEPVSLGRTALEVLPLRHPDAHVLTHEFVQRSETTRWQSGEAAAGVVLPGHNLLIGVVDGGVFALFDPQPEYCTLGIDTNRRLAPGETWHLPETFLAAIAGDAADLMPRMLPNVLEEIAAMRAWQTWYEAEQKGPQPPLEP